MIMHPGPFNTFLAHHTRADEARVILYARLLREAGLLTTGPRGRHAPHMKPVDAARMLIALMATDRPSEAVEALHRWGPMQLDRGMSEGDLPARLFSGTPTLEEVLTRVMDLDYDPANWSILPVPGFQLSRHDRLATLLSADRREWQAVFFNGRKVEERSELFGIKVTCELAPIKLLEIAAEMWADRKEREGAA